MRLMMVLLAAFGLFISTAGWAWGDDDEPFSLVTIPGAALTLSLDGVVVCDENGRDVHDAALLKLFNVNSTVRDVLDVLGPGYVSNGSGTGSVSWRFSNGSSISTIRWPTSLSETIHISLAQ